MQPPATTPSGEAPSGVPMTPSPTVVLTPGPLASAQTQVMQRQASLPAPPMNEHRRLISFNVRQPFCWTRGGGVTGPLGIIECVPGGQGHRLGVEKVRDARARAWMRGRGRLRLHAHDRDRDCDRDGHRYALTLNGSFLHFRVRSTGLPAVTGLDDHRRGPYGCLDRGRVQLPGQVGSCLRRLSASGPASAVYGANHVPAVHRRVTSRRPSRRTRD